MNMYLKLNLIIFSVNFKVFVNNRLNIEYFVFFWKGCILLIRWVKCILKVLKKDCNLWFFKYYIIFKYIDV